MAAELFRLCGDDIACTHRILRQRIDYVFADPGWTTAIARRAGRPLRSLARAGRAAPRPGEANGHEPASRKAKGAQRR